MTAYQDFDRTLADWFTEEDPGASPAGLLEATLAKTGRHQPAPRWLAQWRVPPSAAMARMPRPSLLAGAFAVLLMATLIVVAAIGSSIDRNRVVVIPPATSNPPSPAVSPRATVGPSSSTQPSPTPSHSASPSPNPSPASSPGTLRGPHLVAFSTQATINDTPQLWLAEHDGSDARAVGSGSPDAWSSTGRYLLVYGDNASVVDVHGALGGTIPLGGNAWMPGRDQILSIENGSASGTQPPPKPVIRLYRPDGSVVRRIPPPAGVSVITDPSWSPDGARFVVLGCEGCRGDGEDDTAGASWDLWIVNADGSGSTKITDTPGETEAGPVWSPSGDVIAYWVACAVTLQGCPDGWNATWTIRADGANATKILDDVQYATWLDAGPRLLYAKNVPAGGYRIFTAKPDGSDVQQVSSNAGTDAQPRWVPDSGIAYLHQDPNVQSTSVDLVQDGGGSHQPVTLGTNWASFAWQP